MICDRANAANAKIQAANQRDRGRPPDLATGPSEASETVDHMDADADHDQVSQRRQEVRDKLRGHLVKVRKDLKTGKAELDATDAIQNAGLAESAAREAMALAQDAIDEAEDAVLDALQARATANARMLSAGYRARSDTEAI